MGERGGERSTYHMIDDLGKCLVSGLSGARQRVECNKSTTRRGYRNSKSETTRSELIIFHVQCEDSSLLRVAMR